MNSQGKYAIVIILIAAVIGVVMLKSNDKAEEARAEPVAVESQVIDETEVIEEEPADLPLLLDLGSVNCIPCTAMAPILEQLEVDFADQFEVVFIDVWKDKTAKELYGIKLIPTQIFFDEQGNELFRHVGFFSRQDILSTWWKFDYNFTMPAPGGEPKES